MKALPVAKLPKSKDGTSLTLQPYQSDISTCIDHTDRNTPCNHTSISIDVVNKFKISLSNRY